MYGDTTVRTPTVDRLAREGVRFTHAFVAAPSCTPSRAALLTGQAIHRLEEGGNLHGFLPTSYLVYPDLLEEAGYSVGYTGKGWGPGRFEPGGRTRNPAGPAFKSFDEFMQKREPGTGARAGMRPERVPVPRFLPDTMEVRQDLLDYYFEVQRFDRDLGRVIDLLERAGELDCTMVIVTSDNGLPLLQGQAQPGRDPDQIENVAGRPSYRDAQRRLRARLDGWLRDTGDSRMAGDDDRWDRFPYYGQPAKQ